MGSGPSPYKSSILTFWLLFFKNGIDVLFNLSILASFASTHGNEGASGWGLGQEEFVNLINEGKDLRLLFKFILFNRNILQNRVIKICVLLMIA